LFVTEQANEYGAQVYIKRQEPCSFPVGWSTTD